MQSPKYELPQWCKEAKKALIDRNMNIKELSEALGTQRTYLSGVLNDKIRSPDMQERICAFLDIEAS